MHHFKRFARLLVCFVLLACTLIVNPVSAVSTSSSPVSVTTGMVAPAPGLSLENMATKSTGHLVSVVRYSPYSSSTVIGNLENGTKVTILGKRNGFYKIDCYDMKGYIAKSQVSENEAGEYYVNCVEDSSESRYLDSYSAQKAMDLKSELLTVAPEYIGVRYREAGYSPKYGFDCSGYTKYVFDRIGIELNRSAVKQLSDGVIIAEKDLQPGDLIIYSGTGDDGGFASHVAIYIGNGKIIHSSSTYGVIIADFHGALYPYYQCARRVILTDVSATVALPTVTSITSSVGSGWR